MTVTEHDFEDAIEHSLVTNGGYLTSDSTHFDTGPGLDLVELFSFIEATQQKAWGELVLRGYESSSGRNADRFDRRICTPDRPYSALLGCDLLQHPLQSPTLD